MNDCIHTKKSPILYSSVTVIFYLVSIQKLHPCLRVEKKFLLHNFFLPGMEFKKDNEVEGTF